MFLLLPRRNRQPVLANSPTGIDQFANRYWPICQPVLTKSPTGIDEITNHWWNCIPRNELAIWSIPVGDLANTGWRFWRGGNKNMHYLYVCIVKSVNTGWRIGQYRLANWPIPVGELANTGWRFQNVGDGTFWTSLPFSYEDIYFQLCLANYLSVEGSISFWKKAYLDVCI